MKNNTDRLRQVQHKIAEQVKNITPEFKESVVYASGNHPWLDQDTILKWLNEIANYSVTAVFNQYRGNSPLTPVVQLKGCSVYDLVDVTMECLACFGEVNFIAAEREFALWQSFSAYFTNAGFNLGFNEARNASEKFLIFKEGQLTTSAADYLKKNPHIELPNKQSVVVIDTLNEAVIESLKALLFSYYGTTAASAKLLLLAESINITDVLDALMPTLNLINNARYANHYEYVRGLEMLSKKAHLDSGQFILLESDEIPLKNAVYHYKHYSHTTIDAMLVHQKEQAACIYKVEKNGEINFIYRNFYPFLQT